MTAINFPSVGSPPGAAANTIWLGYLPDRLTMLCPGHRTSALNCVVDAFSAALNIGATWVPYNTNMDGGANAPTCSFTSGQAAPDGSASAYRMVESATSSAHSCTAVTTPGEPNGGGVCRIAAIVGAAERTRCELRISDCHNTNGVKCVFDLAGVQIGVAPAAFSNTTPLWVPGAAAIWSIGGGWRIIFMEFTAGVSQDTNPGWVAQLYIDSGSGTGAESVSYAGDGASGIRVWTASMLPPGAWGIAGNVSFFDDFTSTAGIDLNDTRAPGFNWYVHNQWPAPGYQAGQIDAASSSKISQSGSILTISGNGPASGTSHTHIMTAAPTGVDSGGAFNTSTFVLGRWFQPPLFYECNMAYTFTDDGNNGGGSVAWSTTLEQMTNAMTGLNPAQGPHIVEVDFMESNPGGTQVFNAATNGLVRGSTILRNSILGGFLAYNNSACYDQNTIVVFNGNLYQRNSTSSGSGGVSGQVPTNTTYWNAISRNGISVTPSFDPSQFHTYAVLWLPNVNGQLGSLLSFVDGVCAQSVISGTGASFYGSPLSTSDELHVGDGAHTVLILSAETTYSTKVDYVRVTI